MGTCMDSYYQRANGYQLKGCHFLYLPTLDPRSCVHLARLVTTRLVAMEVQMRSMEEGRMNHRDLQIQPSTGVRLEHSKAPTSCGLLSAGTLTLQHTFPPLSARQHIEALAVASKSAFTDCMVLRGYSLYDTQYTLLEYLPTTAAGLIPHYWYT